MLLGLPPGGPVLRRALQEKLLALPPAFFARASSGDLLSRFASDVAAVEFAVTYGLASYLRDGMQVLVLLGVSIALDWRLAVFAFVAVPLTVVPIVRFARRLRRIAVRGQEQIGGLYTLVHEALQGVRIVQAFGMERYEADRFRAEQDRFLGTMRRSFFVRAIFTPTLELMAAVGIAATVVLAARAVELGRLQPDRVISFLATIVLLYQPLQNLGGTGQGVPRASPTVAGSCRASPMRSASSGSPFGTPSAPAGPRVRAATAPRKRRWCCASWTSPCAGARWSRWWVPAAAERPRS